MDTFGRKQFLNKPQKGIIAFAPPYLLIAHTSTIVRSPAVVKKKKSIPELQALGIKEFQESQFVSLPLVDDQGSP